MPALFFSILVEIVNKGIFRRCCKFTENRYGQLCLCLRLKARQSAVFVLLVERISCGVKNKEFRRESGDVRRETVTPA